MSVSRTPPSGCSSSHPDLSKIHDDVPTNIVQRKRKSPDCHCNYQEILSDFQNKIMSSFQSVLETQNEKINSTLNALRDDLFIFRKEIREINVTIQKLSEEQSSIKKEVDQLISNNNINNHKIKPIMNDAEESRSIINHLSQQLRFKEQQGRINNLELSGIPTVKGENLMSIVHKIANKIGFSLASTDIDSIHRVQRFIPKNKKDAASYNGQPSRDLSSIPNIIVRFTQRQRKREMLAAVRARRGLTTADAGLDGPSKPIFISDHLTPDNKLLYKQARLLVKENNYKYIWLSECKIMVRKNDTSKALLVSCQADLMKIK
ncbi:unnamed protein product [Parnassius mnemosyne]|uniref:FP protein C-terminal domain-containing protein n=1 Tax=Parnassius mnemosyne TaxID=213953 RepID=A0AAV1LGM8_9NEOP